MRSSPSLNGFQRPVLEDVGCRGVVLSGVLPIDGASAVPSGLCVFTGLRAGGPRKRKPSEKLNPSGRRVAENSNLDHLPHMTQGVPGIKAHSSRLERPWDVFADEKVSAITLTASGISYPIFISLRTFNSLGFVALTVIRSSLTVEEVSFFYIFVCSFR